MISARVLVRAALAAAAVSVPLVCVSAAPPAPKTLEIGQPAPDFALPGVDGKTYRLADFQAAKLLLVVFTCNHCPTAQAYEDRIIRLQNDYRDRGLAVVAISPNDPLALRLDEMGYTDVGDSLEDMKIRARDKRFPFPYLYDGDKQEVSAAYGALATPHLFLFDQERKLRYAGRVDDSDVREVKSHDARNAIEALLAGKPVPVEKTRVFGCSTKWSDKRHTVTESLERWNAEPVELETLDAEGVKKLASNGSGKLRLVNVWATWCGPCVDELDELVKLHRMYRKRDFELITISLDEADEKERPLKTLQEKHASMKNYLFTSGDRDKLAEALDPEWPGPLPYTVLIAPGGKVVYRHHRPIDALEVKKAIVGFLGRTYASKKTD
ncbi:MAG: redoxin domain-containing protein [Pirellulales bacterium]|nr:redoxin domain-containing protein [Pirellulales bacterium]